MSQYKPVSIRNILVEASPLMDQPTYTYAHPLSPEPTPAPSNTATPSPQVPPASLTGAPKPVELRYGTHTLHGKLYLISNEEYVNVYHSRFFDISPSEPSFLETVNAHTLMHPVQGQSWIGGGELPKYQDFNRPKGAEICDSFVAVTDDALVWNDIQYLGHCTLNGTYNPQSILTDHPDIIIAIPSSTPLPGTHSTTVGRGFRDVLHYSAIPFPPSLLALIAKIQAAPYDTKSQAATMTGISKRWVTANLKEILDPQTMLLNRESLLWTMRGNLAFWKISIWDLLCYKTTANREEKDANPMPGPWWRNVFEDKQSRERRPGGEELAEVDEKYWDDWEGADVPKVFSEDEIMESAGWPAEYLGWTGGGGVAENAI